MAKPNRERQVRIYDLHSWTGISLGIMMFVVCFTGCLALFHDELHPWEDPVNRTAVAENPVPIHDRFAEWIDENRNGREITFASVVPSSDSQGYFSTQANFRDEEGEFEFIRQRWDSKTGEPLPRREEGANQFLYDLHRDLAWPEALGGRQVGRALVGIVGIAFMLIILSGIIAHSKITKEFFTLRYLRSVRLKWQDTHKVFGLWSLPFSTMIAFTGAFLGIITLLLPLLAAITVRGDTEKLVDELGLGQGEPAGIEAQMLPVDGMLARTHPETGAAARSLFIQHWGDANARYSINYPVDDRLLSSEQVIVSGVDGSEIENADVFQADRLLPRMLAAISPLHYGTYGGIALKIGYLLMGLALAVMAAFGNMMWIERRRYGGEGNKSERFYSILSAFNTGICAGMPAASIAVLYFDKFYIGAEAARYVAVAQFFFLFWAAALIFAFVRRNNYRATRELLALTGFGLVGLPLANGIATGDFFWSAFGTAAAGSAWFDLSFLLLGIITIAAAAKIPADRPVDKRRKSKEKASDTDLGPALQPAE